jgi:hypothetical protein
MTGIICIYCNIKEKGNKFIKPAGFKRTTGKEYLDAGKEAKTGTWGYTI